MIGKKYKNIKGPVMNFFWKTQKKSYFESRTLINSYRMPYYNSSLFSLYAYEESTLRHGPYRQLMHAYWAVEFIQEGEFHVIHNEVKYHLKKGDVLILYPGSTYRWEVPKGEALKKKGIMLNNSPLISLLCNQTALHGREILHPADSFSLHAILDSIRELASTRENDPRLPQKLANAIFSLFTELIAQCGVSNTYDSFNYLLAGIGNFTEVRSLDALAEKFKVGKWTLNRMFKKHLNCTPVQYLIFARMKYASQLLTSNTLSIKAVAEECGYKSPSFFCAEFKKYFQKTPLQFRNEFPIFSDSEMRKFDTWSG